MKIGIIGAGSMGGAVIRAILRGGIAAEADLTVCRRNPEKGVPGCAARVTGDAAEAVSRSDAVILAVKPQQAEKLLPEIRAAFAGKFVLSVMAGWPFDRLTAALPEDARVLCAMPNTPLQAGEGMTLLSVRTSCSEEEKDFAVRLFSSAGRIAWVEESFFDAANAVSGCGPAYAFIFIEALADAAVRGGVPRRTAYELAAQMLLGSAKLALESGAHPGALKDAVCSPGGMTIEGVRALEEGGFRAAVMRAVGACAEKGAAMAAGGKK